MAKVQPSPHREDDQNTPAEHRKHNRRKRGDAKLFISFLPDGKGGAKEDKGSVPLEVDVEAHIEERTDCEPGLYRIEKKRSGEFSGDVLFYTKDDITDARSVSLSIADDGETAAAAGSFEDLDDSPMQRLLDSLQERSGARVMVLARRKPDPAGMLFRNPCRADYTAGEVPYDESDPSIEALELAIQKLYGGGRYEIVVRQNGASVGSVLRNISDPPLPETSGPIPTIAPSPLPAKSGIEEIKESVGVFKEVASVLSSARPESRAERETSSPLKTVKEALSLVREMNNALPTAKGDDAGSTVRDWMDGIASIGREFGLGQLINNLTVFGLNEAARKRAAEQQPPTGVAASPDPIGNTAAPRVIEPVAAVAPPFAGGFSIDMLPPPMRIALDHALTVVVSEMQRSEECEEHETELAVAALDHFAASFPDALPLLDQFMSQPSMRLVLFLSSLKPEWSNLPDLEDAAGFISSIKQDWVEHKQSEQLLTGEEGENGAQQDRAN